MRALGGDEWAAWLREHGLVGLDGIDTRSLVLRLRDAGAMRAAAVSDESELPVDERSARGARAALDGGAGARRAGLGPGAVRLRRDGLATRRRRRLRRQALDHAPAREGGRRRDRRARTRPPQTSSRPSTASSSRTAPATPSRSSRRRRSCASSSAGCRSSGSASATSCSASRRGHRTYKLPFGHRGAEPPRARAAHAARARDEPEPRLRGRGLRASGGDRTSRSTTARSRGSTSPTLRARSVQFHPEAGPGPHDAWPILESFVEELRR